MTSSGELTLTKNTTCASVEDSFGLVNCSFSLTVVVGWRAGKSLRHVTPSLRVTIHVSLSKVLKVAWRGLSNEAASKAEVCEAVQDWARLHLMA